MSKKKKEIFSPKRKRQFRHILLSELKMGKSAETAKRIAGATVNKTRKKKGELKNDTETRSGKRNH